jgi:hypothetical protein
VNPAHAARWLRPAGGFSYSLSIFSKGFPMFYIICPFCQARIEIPASAVGPDRSDPWNVTSCDECSMTFDYDDEEVLSDGEQATA